jgi:hypothetical protein
MSCIKTLLKAFCTYNSYRLALVYIYGHDWSTGLKPRQVYWLHSAVNTSHSNYWALRKIIGMIKSTKMIRTEHEVCMTHLKKLVQNFGIKPEESKLLWRHRRRQDSVTMGYWNTALKCDFFQMSQGRERTVAPVWKLQLPQKVWNWLPVLPSTLFRCQGIRCSMALFVTVLKYLVRYEILEPWW